MAVCLVDQGREKEFQSLYKEFKDDASAIWQYTYALFLFKKEGSSLKSNRALKKAYETNPFIFEFLMGQKPLPDYLPQYMGLGDENEVIHCLNDSSKIWVETEGALAWAPHSTK